MSELIPPRRNEFLTKEGVPTARFANYLERLTETTNTTETDVDLVNAIRPTLINSASKAELEALVMTLSSALSRINALEQHIASLELYMQGSDMARIAELEKKIQALSLIP